MYSGLRIGFYESVRDAICGENKDKPSLLQKVAAAMLTGAMAITVASPTDLAKVRLQSQGLMPAAERIYNSSSDVYA